MRFLFHFLYYVSFLFVLVCCFFFLFYCKFLVKPEFKHSVSFFFNLTLPFSDFSSFFSTVSVKSTLFPLPWCKLYTEYVHFSVPEQLGSVPFQVPSIWQRRELLSFNRNPGLQENVALVFTEMSIEFVLETPVDKFIMVDAETVSGGQNISATKK